VTFDSDYDLTSVQESDVSGNADAYLAVSGKTIIVTLGTDIAKTTATYLTIANIKNPAYVQTTDSFSLETRNSSGYAIDRGTIAGVTTLSGIITIPSITASSYIAGASNTQYSFTFTPTHSVSAGGYLRIDFDVSDNAYDASNAIVSAGASTFVIPSGGANKNYVTLMFSQDIDVGSQQYLQLSGITNPQYVKNVTIRLTTEVSTGEKIDTSDYGPIAITAAPLSGLSLIMSSTTALDISRHTFSFTVVNAIDSGGKVEITFDSDYTLTGVGSGDVSGNSGSTVAVSGSKLVITIGTAIAKSTQVSLAISNIKNPVYVQTTDSFAIQSTTSDGAIIDTATMSALSITTGALSNLSVTATSKKISDVTSYTFNFTVQHAVPADGFIRIQFDSNYSLGSAYLDTASFYSLTKGSDYLKFKTVSAISAGQAVSIPIAMIANPSYVYTVSNFQVKTMTAVTTSQQIMDSGEITGVTLNCRRLIQYFRNRIFCGSKRLDQLYICL